MAKSIQSCEALNEPAKLAAEFSPGQAKRSPGNRPEKKFQARFSGAKEKVCFHSHCCRPLKRAQKSGFICSRGGALRACPWLPYFAPSALPMLSSQPASYIVASDDRLTSVPDPKETLLPLDRFASTFDSGLRCRNSLAAESLDRVNQAEKDSCPLRRVAD